METNHSNKLLYISILRDNKELCPILKESQIGILLSLNGTIECCYGFEHEYSLQNRSGIMFTTEGKPSKLKVGAGENGIFVAMDIIRYYDLLVRIGFEPADTNLTNKIDRLIIPDDDQIQHYIEGLYLYIMDQQSNELVNCYDRLLALLEPKLAEFFWLLGAKMKQILVSFLSPYLNSEKRMFDQLIEAHYKDNWTIDKWAHEVGYSSSKFKRTFKRLYGTSPHKMIQDLRLDEAKKIILHSSKTVSEICYSLGYENISHFIQVFRTKYGVTPISLRREQELVRG